MLVLEIAAGIVLGVVILRYWRRIVGFTGLLVFILVAVALLIGAVVWLSSLTRDDLRTFAIAIAVLVAMYSVGIVTVIAYRRAVAYWKRRA